MAIFKNLDDDIKCPKCGWTGTSAIGGVADCPLGHGLFPYEGQSELDAAVQETKAAVDKSTEALNRLTFDTILGMMLK